MTNQTEKNSTAQICALNDKFRQTFDAKLGKVVITQVVGCLNTNQLQKLLQAVKQFSDFNENNDPWKEHDMGKIELFDEKFFFKIDYFDRQKYQQGIGSEEPYNVDKTFRVMTIMLASEY
ncbi:Protein of unknown function (DUF3768) [Rivularia sp. PCC 7116]|uniref:DUF3768 domain-containing protein n=1 Tax=Rivularia sp. PCC 7116 TaxID=373994 RepID=UPI00029EE327|nr:DUF3768 domain-containing protein [Rivularia sp. PCC 7116]AFY57325.1 Protein of unknown function (DUF3768) [Rivularia sp. PCC 7116]